MYLKGIGVCVGCEIYIVTTFSFNIWLKKRKLIGQLVWISPERRQIDFRINYSIDKHRGKMQSERGDELNEETKRQGGV